jgi:hypothetical protein
MDFLFTFPSGGVLVLLSATRRTLDRLPLWFRFGGVGVQFAVGYSGAWVSRVSS